MSSTEKQQRLVLSVLEFLNQSIADGTVKSDDKESIEVAVQCIGEAFGVDPSDSAQVSKLSVKPATLQSIFDVYLKTKDKVGSSSTPAASTSASSSSGPSAEDKSKADKLKAEGNALMSAKKYDEAIASYTKAITLDATNPIYFSNRAAAYASKSDFLSAVGDAEQALQVDPTFVKAYHRLGHAQYSLGDYRAAAEVFSRGLALDPNNAGLKTGLENAEARVAAEEEEADQVSSPARGVSPTTPAAPAGMPDMAGMSEMLRGMGGGGGGMPDIASLMSNPALMGMAQQMMGNGGLENLMRNPAVAGMMNRMQNGDMPNMSELMQDPALRDLASQFGAGAGGR